MLHSYEAQLQGNQVIWLGAAPPMRLAPRRVVVVLDDAANDDTVHIAPPPNRAQRQADLRQALADVVQAGTFAHVVDACAWQREVRAERPQPGREE